MSFLRSKWLWLLGLPILLAGTCAYLLTDDEFVRAQLSRQISKHTGWEVQVDGGFSLQWGKISVLEVQDFRLLNPAWSEQPEMFSGGSLRFALEPLALFDRQLVIHELRLEDCRGAYLEKAGHSNWLPVNYSPMEDGDEPSSADKFKWQLQSLNLLDCHVNVSTDGHQKPLLVHLGQARVKVDSTSVLTIQAKGALDEQELSVDGRISPLNALWQGGAVQHELQFVAGQVELNSKGSMDDFRMGKGADLEFSFRGPEIRNVTEWLALPEISSGAFDTRLVISEQEGSGLMNLQLDGDLGSLQVKGSGQLDKLVAPNGGAFDLSVAGPNLTAIGELLGQEWLIYDPFTSRLVAEIQQGETRIESFDLLAGDEQISASGVLGRWPGLAGSRVRIDASSKDISQWQPASEDSLKLYGTMDFQLDVNIDQLSQVQMQANGNLGSNQLSIEGRLGKLDDLGRPDVKFTLNSPSLEDVAGTIGQSGWPNEAIVASGRLQHEGDVMDLQDVKLEISGARLELGGKLQLSDRLKGSEIKVKLVLDSLEEFGRLLGADDMPDQALTLSADLSRPGNGLEFDINDGDMGGIHILAIGTIPDIDHLLAMNSEFSLDLPSLKLAEAFLPDTELPDLPVTAAGKLVNSGELTQFRGLKLTLGQASASLDAEWVSGERHVGSKATVSVSGKDLKELWPKAPAELELGAFNASLSLERKKDGDYLEGGKIGLGFVDIDLSGQIDDIAKAKDYDLDLRFQGQDASRLNTFTRQPFTAEPFDLQFHLAGKPGNLQFRQLELTQGGSDLQGHLQLQLTDRPRLSGELKSTELRLSPWVERARDENQKKAPERAVGPVSGEKPRDRFFDDEPFELSVDLPLDLDLQLQVGHLVMSKNALRGVKLGIRIEPGMIQLRPIEFQGMPGGSYTGRIQVGRTGAESVLDIQAQGKNIKLGLAGLSGQDPTTLPPSNILLDLTSKGKTWHDIALAMRGKLRWYAGAGFVSNSNLSFMFSDLLTEVLTTLNPMSKKSELTQLDCGVYAANVADGIVRIEPIVAQTNDITMFSDGTINLETEEIDLSFRTVARKGLGISAGSVVNPFFKLGGTLMEPGIELDAKKGAISSGAMVATAGLSVLFKSFSDRVLSSKDPCGDARKAIEEADNEISSGA